MRSRLRRSRKESPGRRIAFGVRVASDALDHARQQHLEDTDERLRAQPQFPEAAPQSSARRHSNRVARAKTTVQLCERVLRSASERALRSLK
jgi:hypothetical protein